MKLLIDCNEVFDILTRGPFPSGGAHDDAVEHHLRSCHDCRQLAEALRPAVQLFHECLSEQEAKALPEYHGQVAPLGSGIQESLFRALPRDIRELRMEGLEGESRLLVRGQDALRESQRSSRAALLLQGLIGMALTGAIVLTVISLGMSVRHMERTPAMTGTEAARRLLSWQLPGECVMDGLRERVASGQLGEQPSLELQLALAWEQRVIDCCTRCHHAGESLANATMLDAAEANTRMVATVQNSCIVCHMQKVGA